MSQNQEYTIEQRGDERIAIATCPKCKKEVESDWYEVLELPYQQTIDCSCGQVIFESTHIHNLDSSEDQEAAMKKLYKHSYLNCKTTKEAQQKVAQILMQQSKFSRSKKQSTETKNINLLSPEFRKLQTIYLELLIDCIQERTGSKIIPGVATEYK